MILETYRIGDFRKGGRCTICTFSDIGRFRDYIRRQAKRGFHIYSMAFDLSDETYRIELRCRSESDCCFDCINYTMNQSKDVPRGSCDIFGHVILKPMEEICPLHRR